MGKDSVQGEAKSPIAISESADEPQTLQGTEVSPMLALFFALYPWKNRSSPKAVSVVMSAVPANVTTDTAFAFHSGTSGSEGHRAIADMFCWLATRVALLWEMTHLCRNPQTVGRGFARRFPVIVPKAAPQGLLRWHCQPLLAVLGKIFRCKGMKPLSDGLGIHCQQAEIFLIIA